MTAPSEDDFRAEVVAFLTAHATPRTAGRSLERDVTPDRVSLPVVGAVPPEQERAELAAARAWRRLRFDNGLGWITGPVDLGGRGLPASYERVYDQEEAAFDAPERGYLRTGVNIVAPTIQEFGTRWAHERYLAGIMRADEVVCQLFSEPGAGSDLANVSTRAVRDGDEWVITGQKVWSSGAHYATVGECLARTNPEASKHRGLSMFLVDMDAPGIEIRPIRQMTGGAEFDEVFLDEVRVPVDALVGEVDGGWAVTMHTLMNERSAIGDELVPDRALIDRLVELAQHEGLDQRPDLRLAVADLVMRLRATRAMVDDILAGIGEDEVPGPELALAKLAATDDVMRIADVVSDILGARLVADTGEWGAFSWTEFVLGVHGLRIGGGTDEVLRNGVGEHVLGLPREPR